LLSLRAPVGSTSTTSFRNVPGQHGMAAEMHLGQVYSAACDL
jgi:hypothetical protein